MDFNCKWWILRIKILSISIIWNERMKIFEMRRRKCCQPCVERNNFQFRITLKPLTQMDPHTWCRMILHAHLFYSTDPLDCFRLGCVLVRKLYNWNEPASSTLQFICWIFHFSFSIINSTKKPWKYAMRTKTRLYTDIDNDPYCPYFTIGFHFSCIENSRLISFHFIYFLPTFLSFTLSIAWDWWNHLIKWKGNTI